MAITAIGLSANIIIESKILEKFSLEKQSATGAHLFASRKWLGMFSQNGRVNATMVLFLRYASYLTADYCRTKTMKN